ncbi:purine-cytosine permease family protein [Nocardioides nitrophenolicus]|uniref:purine-cytosine permease family protein n=1 Tax=Nocardioides nitrophenolicus TaxID=60489 RepID=UPI001959849E|nr:cytosine permease [Nocardioides nitrophenolicus]MBM7515251.1 purine-cytosine permease-like protein [Nocardioides nitrophenolicus]
MGEPTAAGIEVHGVDTIPEAERTARPRDVVSILVGTNLCLGLVIFGWLPATFGLSFWACLTAQVAGTFLAIALVAPMALISMRTGTNLSTSSGASFGVRGRLVGSVIGLLLSLGYASLTIWTGGAAVVEPLAELVGLPDGSASYVVVYAALAAGAVLVAVFGYRVLTRLGSWLAVAMSVLMVAGMLALAGRFDPAPVVDGGYLLGDFWTTWFLAFVATGISGPIAFITLLGDYTRYLSPERHSSRRVLAATAGGLALGLLLPQLFGMFTTFAARAGDDYVGALVAATPVWFLPLLLLNGVFGTVGNAGVLLYSMGLDLDAIVPALSRVKATMLVSVLSIALVVTGYFVWDAADAVTAFLLLMTAAGTPWAVITVIGFLRCRGSYDPDALQVYNRRSRGGIYWYTGGWSVTATVAWAVGTVLGLLSVDSTIWRGPILELTGGVDVSPLLAGAAAAVTYLLLSRFSVQPMPEMSPSLVRSTR